MMAARPDRFGEYLLKAGAITREALSTLLEAQRLNRERLGVLTVRHGYLSEKEMTRLLAEFLGMPLLVQQVTDIDRKLLQLIPRKMALKNGIIPIGTDEKNAILCACAGAVGMNQLLAVARLADRPVKLVLTTPGNLKRLQNQFYSREFDTTIRVSESAAGETDTGMIVELIEKLLVRAVTRGASDIHLEPRRDSLEIRLRIDGLLQSTETLPATLAGKLASRLKVLSGLDIAERRRPQDGAFIFRPEVLDIDLEAINIRTSVFPIVTGEKVVLRLLPAPDEEINIDGLGLGDDDRAAFNRLLKLNHGIILVTGPTGSGKSTTLYGALQILRRETTLNITTIEDPVELQLKGINQAQVDGGIKMSFPAALRAILRQDPDVIMVGEIRDGETIRIALQAAITGHLVLSTLHTNDAASAVTRLLDLGAERFLVGISMRAVLAQRLVRLVCPRCAAWHDISAAEWQLLGLEPIPGARTRRGAGCEGCNGTGYQGRTGIFELLICDREIQRLINTGATADDIAGYARGLPDYHSLRDDGIRKITTGMTTPEEVVRVTME
ncbi:MAG: Flp pilus assembly complex ATPase component TadA [Deltaproteobacteria bacterium]|nr:Flp pilus assembly complex ATPase component TadA [Candidatus Anaeroferrophillacea bacterium]